MTRGCCRYSGLWPAAAPLNGKSIRGFLMNIYENVVILDASLSDEDIEAATEKIKEFMTRSGLELLKTDIWGRKKLANEIKKHKKGFYVLLTFKADPSLIKKIEDYYKVFDTVIKFMVIKLGKKQAAYVTGMLNQAAAAKPEPNAAQNNPEAVQK